MLSQIRWKSELSTQIQVQEKFDEKLKCYMGIAVTHPYSD